MRAKFDTLTHEYPTRTAFPNPGKAGFLYRAIDTGLVYKCEAGGGPDPVYTPVGGEGQEYTHTQATAAHVWNIQHNMGKKEVSAIVFDEGGDRVYGFEDYPASTANLLVYRFDIETAGQAIIRG